MISPISQPGPAIFLFKDLSSFWGNNPFIIRKLKEFAVRAQSKTLIVIGEEEAVPERLREDLVILYQGLPAIAEIIGAPGVPERTCPAAGAGLCR